MEESPEMHGQLVSSHGMLVILEVLEARRHRDVTVKLLQIINLVSFHPCFDEEQCVMLPFGSL
jgi:hypothetical protein